MLWLGLIGRRKIAELEARMEVVERTVREADLELTVALDKLTGIAKRFTGRKGGRPLKETPENGEEAPVEAFTRHVL